MPTVSSSQLRVNQPIEVDAPDATLTVTVDPGQPLRIGRHTFQLEVVDDAGNRSAPDQVRLIVVDDQKPTAVIVAPSTVPFGASFTLNGSRSVDVGGGRIIKYIWTLLE